MTTLVTLLHELWWHCYRKHVLARRIARSLYAQGWRQRPDGSVYRVGQQALDESALDEEDEPIACTECGEPWNGREYCVACGLFAPCSRCGRKTEMYNFCPACRSEDPARRIDGVPYDPAWIAAQRREGKL